MNWALSTRWNARRHRDGRALVDEILAAGFRALELSYDLRRDLVEGVEARVREGAVEIVSVHAFCPVPSGVPSGHPELWLPASLEPEERRKAVQHLGETIRFAGSLCARAVVVHGGYVRMKNRSARLIRLAAAGRREGWWWRWHWSAALRDRERRVARHLDALRASLEELQPVLAECGVRLGLENLPSWEAVPAEREVEELLRGLPPAQFGVWHDFGHGQIRENLGWTNHRRMLENLADRVVGFHVHDVTPPATDHVLPPEGMIPFADFAQFARLPVPYVIEPPRDAPPEALQKALQHLNALWRPAHPSWETPT
ncbi:MAG: sugar phosphate isomerase/epimerase [Kiritimatiellae bacterium]|nr:sugar phosphate isomerase/epimerase [Kiritimatiellia bacterium]